MAYFTLNMQPHGQLPLVKALQAIQDAGSGNWTASDKSTAASPGTPPASACGPAASSAAPYAEAPAVPPAARQCAVSAPELSAPLPGTSAPPTTPEVSALSCTELAALRSKSSPFQRDGLGWAAQYNSDQHMEASISVASAVFTPEQSLQRLIAVRRSGSSLQRRMHGLPYVLTPRLSAHTSTLLRTSPNPLEEALSEDLANNDLPVLFLHGVGGLPAYLEMLLHVSAASVRLCRAKHSRHIAALSSQVAVLAPLTGNQLHTGTVMHAVGSCRSHIYPRHVVLPACRSWPWGTL